MRQFSKAPVAVQCIFLQVLLAAAGMRVGVTAADEGPGRPGPKQEHTIDELISRLTPKMDDPPDLFAEAVNGQAVAEFSRIGEPAIAPLMHLLSDDDERRREAGAYTLGQIPAATPHLVAALEDDERRVRLAAAEALGFAGAKARFSLRQTIVYLSMEGRQRMLLALDDDDRKLIEPYVRLWRNVHEEKVGAALFTGPRDRKDPASQAAATARRLATVLGELRGAVPKIIATCRDENHDGRTRAVRALGQIGPTAEQAIPWLVAILQEHRPELDRYERRRLNRLKDLAGSALGRIGPAAEEVVPVMIATVQQIENDEGSPENLYDALAAIAPHRDDVFQLFATAVRRGNDTIRQTAAYKLAAVGPRAVAPLTGALSDARQHVRFAAAGSLGRIGPPAQAAVPALRNLAESDPDRSVRDAARRAIGRIDAGGDIRRGE